MAKECILDGYYTDVFFLLDINTVSEIIQTCQRGIVPSTVHSTVRVMVHKAAEFAKVRDLTACVSQIDETLAFLESYIRNQKIIYNRLVNDSGDLGDLNALPAECKHEIAMFMQTGDA